MKNEVRKVRIVNFVFIFLNPKPEGDEQESVRVFACRIASTTRPVGTLVAWSLWSWAILFWFVSIDYQQ